jgi:hypothetical protein
VIDLGIPAGSAGATGATGPSGKDGVTPAFSVGSVTTGDPGTSAAVTATTSNGGANVALAFTIPRGATGSGGGSSVSLSDATPSALGTASAGTSTLASRADHVHATPVISYTALTNVPSTFTPATHQHAISDVTGLQTALDGKQSSGTYATLVSGLVPTANLPLATTSAAGAVIVGTGLAISSGVLSATGGGIGANDAVDGGDYVGVIGDYAGAPTGLTGSAGGTSVTLSWTAPTSNGGTAITDYAVQYSSDSGSTWTTFADGTSTAATATVTGLTRGTAYVFRVAAVNSRGNGAWSDVSASITPPTNATVPGAPTNVAGTVDYTSSVVTWTAPGDGGAAITDYLVQFSSDNGSTWTTFSDGTSTSATATVTGLTNGTAYKFRVAAVNSVGTGSYSTASASVTPNPLLTVSLTDYIQGTTYSGRGSVVSPASISGSKSYGSDNTNGSITANANGTIYYTWYYTTSSAGSQFGFYLAGQTIATGTNAINQTFSTSGNIVVQSGQQIAVTSQTYSTTYLLQMYLVPG